MTTLKSKMTKLEMHWVQFVLGLATDIPDAYVQIRKLFRDKVLEIPWKDWDGVGFKPENLGYSPGPAKMNQLRRNYLSIPELEKARDSLIERSKKTQSCITARFGNGAKDSRSQGFCMQTITLNYLEKPENNKPKFVVELYYRSTEVGQKFMADLIFLDKVVFPILLKGLPKPDVIRFRFSTLYLSSMFLPIFFQRYSVMHFLTCVSTGDPKWFTRCVRIAVDKWMTEECTYNYRTRAKMHELFRKYVYPQIPKNEISEIRRKVKK